MTNQYGGTLGFCLFCTGLKEMKNTTLDIKCSTTACPRLKFRNGVVVHLVLCNLVVVVATLYCILPEQRFKVPTDCTTLHKS